tara:strand:+ start:403 stop:675 length:273 start_codon:yes stop_codon:yes gene_type:complete
MAARPQESEAVSIQQDSDHSESTGTKDPAPVPPQRNSHRPLPASVSDRLTIYVARGGFFLAAVGLGIQGTRALQTNAGKMIFGKLAKAEK